MAITLNGTTGIQNVLGSASAPAESNTTSSNTGLYFPTSTTLGLSTAGTNALYVDASQNVGIGTTATSSYGSPLTIYAATNPVLAIVSGNANAYLRLYSTSDNNMYLINNGGSMVMNTANSERMRIDSSGNLLVGTTTVGLGATTGVGINYNGNAFYISIGHPTGTATGAAYQSFSYNGGAIGSITQSGTTAVLYNVTSDQRLKTNIIDAPSALSIIDAIQIRSFDWKADNSHNRYGVIAQELNQLVPEAVHTPIAENDMMGVDYSKLVPILIKSFQELKSEFDAYKTAHP